MNRCFRFLPISATSQLGRIDNNTRNLCPSTCAKEIFILRSTPFNYLYDLVAIAIAAANKRLGELGPRVHHSQASWLKAARV